MRIMTFAVTIETADNVSVNEAETDLKSNITGMAGDEGPTVYDYKETHLTSVKDG